MTKIGVSISSDKTAAAQRPKSTRNHHLAIVFSQKMVAHRRRRPELGGKKISGKSYLHHDSRTRGKKKKARTQQDNLGQMTFVKMVEGTS